MILITQAELEGILRLEPDRRETRQRAQQLKEDKKAKEEKRQPDEILPENDWVQHMYRTRSAVSVREILDNHNMEDYERIELIFLSRPWSRAECQELCSGLVQSAIRRGIDLRSGIGAYAVQALEEVASEELYQKEAIRCLCRLHDVAPSITREWIRGRQ